MFRIGYGTDTHHLIQGSRLFIGGIDVPSDRGSKAHSDGDVVIHALTDAILGALTLGDIGTHFPDTDRRWKNAASEVFLSHAAELMHESGYQLSNADITVELEEPKIQPFTREIRDNLARILGCRGDKISVKAKTAEGTGLIGEGKLIAATAVVLLHSS